MLANLSDPLASLQAPNVSGGHWNMPENANPFFVDHQALLPDIAVRLKPGVCLALHGGAGVGKTQLAFQFAYQNRSNFPTGVLWVNAQNQETLLSSFASLSSKDLLNLQVDSAMDSSLLNKVELVKRSLESMSGWLLIFDNCDWVFEEGRIECLEQFASYFPYSMDGRILLVTRHKPSGFGADEIELKPMLTDMGGEFLLRRAGILNSYQEITDVPEEVLETARDISRTVEGLPLTLEIVGAYLAETPTVNVSNYLLKYRNELFELRRKWGVTFQPESVATACRVSQKAAVAKSQYIVNLMNLCVFFDPESIPITLVPATLLVEMDMTRSTKINSQDYAYQVSENFSLLKYDYDSSSISLHRLVQDALRNEMDEEVQSQWRALAVQVTMDAAHSMQSDPNSNFSSLLPHWRLCAGYIREYDISNEAASRLLLDFSSYLLDNGLMNEAESVCRLSLQTCEGLLGREAPDSLMNVINLIRICADSGNLEESKALTLRLVEAFDATLGDEEMDPTLSADPSVILYSPVTGSSELFPRFEKSQMIRFKMSQGVELDRAGALNNIGIAYYTLKRYENAESLFEQALKFSQVMNSASTACSLLIYHNLTELRRVQGRYDTAEFEYLELLQRYRREGISLNTAFACNHLAGLYRMQYNVHSAERLYLESLKIRQELAGADSVLVASSKNNLAALYHQIKRFDDAELLYKQSLEVFEKTSGKSHPNAQAVQMNYSLFLEHQGRGKEASELQTRFALSR